MVHRKGNCSHLWGTIKRLKNGGEGGGGGGRGIEGQRELSGENTCLMLIHHRVPLFGVTTNVPPKAAEHRPPVSQRCGQR